MEGTWLEMSLQWKGVWSRWSGSWSTSDVGMWKLQCFWSSQRQACEILDFWSLKQLRFSWRFRGYRRALCLGDFRKQKLETRQWASSLSRIDRLVWLSPYFRKPEIVFGILNIQVKDQDKRQVSMDSTRGGGGGGARGVIETTSPEDENHLTQRE